MEGEGDQVYLESRRNAEIGVGGVAGFGEKVGAGKKAKRKNREPSREAFGEIPQLEGKI